ncbi:protein prenyltransferase alpha subunit repeat-containing protein 1-like [Dendronephthya gigantea]|uniref:protein prenyltransferase alpha subunit repeat-containing protein 1-like n=1 Tax=Dendronephthya gigantea TaxID=151771 RepID=UPI00106C1E12|nr:protein prenyltransferase alpha subunit repeat-containing protein 1-like [Dendronephthya gigantea]
MTGVYYFEEIDRIFNDNTEIEEFDIIPAMRPESKSCCPYVLDENKLGIFSWCVKDLFCYVYRQLMEKKRWKCIERTEEGVYIMKLSRIALLLHAEDYTIWNLRKCCITKQIEKQAKMELDFSALVLRKHPRSAETFSHRRWLINLLQRLQEKLLKTPQFCQQELELSLLCADRYRDNYITWDHRCWVVENFMLDKITWFEEELNSTKNWLWSHVSDNCVYHFREQLLKKLAAFCSLEKMRELLLAEFKLTDEIINHYAVFETVWYHRQFIISFWSTKFQLCHSCLITWGNTGDQMSDKFKLLKDSENKLNSMSCQSCGHLDKNDVISITNEMKFCRQIILQNNDHSPKLIRQSALAKSHVTWMRFFVRKYYKNLQNNVLLTIVCMTIIFTIW